MLKRPALVLSLAALAVAGLSCGDPAGLPTTGSISLVLVSEGGNVLSIVAPDGNVLADLVPAPSQPSNVTLTSVRVTVAGATNKSETSTTPSGGFFDITVGGLTAGTYSVTVEGLVNNEVAHFGQTSGVAVTAGATSQATVTFSSFTPVIPLATVVDTSDVLHFNVNYGAVTGAAGYIVAWSANANMSGASTKNVTGTSTDITVPSEGTYYVTVKAVNSTVQNGGAPSAPKSVFVFQGVATVTVTPASPPPLAAGATLQFTAEGKDGDGNVVPNVTWIWISSNQAAATINPQSGLATGIGGGQATITALGKFTGGNATLTVGNVVGSKLAFSIQPASTVAGDALSPAVQVEIQDASGNRITTARDPVTIAFGSNPGGGTMTGTKVVNAIDGIASFSGLWVNKAAAGYTLAATSGSLTGATSSAFTVSPAAPFKLAYSQQPVNTQGNTVMTAPTVTIADMFDNATTSNSQVTVALGANFYKNFAAAGGVLSGTQTIAATNGVATFSTLRVDKPSPAYTLVASATGLVSATSNPFNINLSASQMAPSRFGTHTCAVATGGPYCWGNNGNGQLGALTGGLAADSVAALVRGGLTFIQMTSGGSHSCGLTASNDAYCWGYNGNGELGDGTTTPRPQPVAVTGSHKFAQISAGANHTCGVTTTNVATPAEHYQVYCWGYNYDGELGNVTGPNGANSSTPIRLPLALPPVGFTYASVSAGGFHTCTLLRTDSPTTPSRVICWGYNQYGQTADGSAVGSVPYRGPVYTSGLQTFASVTTGYLHTCAVAAPAAPGNGFCWGNDDNGRLGDDIAPAHKSVPTVISGGATWGSIKAGGNHTCGLTSGGASLCWGYNHYGQLGNGTSGFNTGTSQDQPLPVQAGLGFTFTTLEAGQYHTCGLVGTNMYCWGRGSAGQLGSGDRLQVKETPTQIIQ